MRRRGRGPNDDPAFAFDIRIGRTLARSINLRFYRPPASAIWHFKHIPYKLGMKS